MDHDDSPPDPHAATMAATEAPAALETPSDPGPERSHVFATLLSFEGGIFGFDRFYLGRIGTGILKALTLGGALVWWYIDLFRLSANRTRDIEGRALVGDRRRNPTVLVHLSAFGGLFGLDRLYLGHWPWWLVKLLTLGGCGVWWLYDLYLVCSGRLADRQDRPIEAERPRYQTTAILFSVAAGVFGLDRHYLGYRSLALLKFFTMGGAGIWYIVDIILLVVDRLPDADGNPLRHE